MMVVKPWLFPMRSPVGPQGYFRILFFAVDASLS